MGRRDLERLPGASERSLVDHGLRPFVRVLSEDLRAELSLALRVTLLEHPVARRPFEAWLLGAAGEGAAPARPSP